MPNSVAVKMPETMPPRMITITSRPGTAAPIERHIASLVAAFRAG